MAYSAQSQAIFSRMLRHMESGQTEQEERTATAVMNSLVHQNEAEYNQNFNHPPEWRISKVGNPWIELKGYTCIVYHFGQTYTYAIKAKDNSLNQTSLSKFETEHEAKESGLKMLIDFTDE